MNKYLATVRVRGQHIKTMVYADSAVHARLLLQYQFGMDCMVLGPQATNEAADEYKLLDSMIKPKPPMTPAQARVIRWQHKLRLLRKLERLAAVRWARALRSLETAEKNLKKAEGPPNP